MKKIDFGQLLKKSAPYALTVISSIGVAATGYFSVKGTIKAVKLLEEKKKQTGLEKLDTKETVSTCWKCYIPAVAAGAISIAGIITNTAISKKSHSEMMALCAAVGGMYQRYSNKVKEIHGEEAHREIIESIACERSKSVSISAPTCVKNTCLAFDEDEEEYLFYDELLDTYFRSTKSKVLQAQYHLNRNYVLGDAVTLNDYRGFLGLDLDPEGDDHGWSITEDEIYWLDFNNYKTVLPNGVECFIIETIFEPTTYFMKYEKQLDPAENTTTMIERR